MFKVIPAFSVSEGKVVIIQKGDFSDKLKYNFSVLDLAKLLEDIGIEVVHFLDLDGAKRESPVNYHTLEVLAGHTNLKVAFMGGIRTDGDINKVLEYGATFFTVSSVAVNNNELFASWIMSYGREKLSMMANVADGKLTYEGFRKKADVDMFEVIDYFYMRGLKYLKVADITRDGVVEGPNFDLCQSLIDKFPNILMGAGGGVRSLDDVQRFKDMGFYAVIIGRALYEGKIKVEDLKVFVS